MLEKQKKTVFGKVLFKAIPKKETESQPIIILTNPQFRISDQIIFKANNGWQEVEITNQDDWTSVFVAYGWDKLKNLPFDLSQKYEAGIYPLRLVLDNICFILESIHSVLHKIN